MLADKPDDELLDWLDGADENARPDRLARLKYLRSLYPAEQDTLLFGGVVVPIALHEMRLTYVFGLDLACVLTAQVVLEHLLNGVLGWNGSDDHDDSGLRVLAKQAFDRSYISEPEHKAIDSLRRVRNPYTHPRPVMAEGCLIRRTAEAGVPMEEVIKRDAELALVTVIGLITRPPFAFPHEDAPDAAQGT